MELWENLLVSIITAIIAAVGTFLISRKQFSDQLKLQFNEFQSKIIAERQSLVEEKLMDKKLDIYQEVLQTAFKLNMLITNTEVNSHPKNLQEMKGLRDNHRRSVWMLMLYEKDNALIIKLKDIIEIESQLCNKYNEISYKIFMEEWKSIANNMRNKLGFSFVDFEKKESIMNNNINLE